jgi:hypothetical protein
MTDDFFADAEETLAKKALDSEKQQEERNEEKEYEFWNEEDTPLLKCVMEKLSYWRDKWDKLVPILIVKNVDTDEHLKVWGSRTMLKRSLEDLEPAIGTPMALQCLGKQEGKNGSYYLYNAIAEKIDPELWAAARNKFLKEEKERADETPEPAATSNTSGYAPDEAPF